MIILIILIILVLLSFNLFSRTLKNRNNTLNDVNNQNSVRRKQFSMYVENDSGEYEEYNSSELFPSGYKLNLDKSVCVDINGLEVPNVLSSDGNAVTVTSNKTVFCYVYFDIKETLSRYLINNVSSSVLWNSTLEGDGYRYIGTNPSNYICFGTTDKDTCVNDTDKYMYRIIGVFEDNDGNKHTKLIKKEALNTVYAWHSDETIDVDWNKSDLYNGLNGSYFLTNPSYSYMQDTTWTDKIATWNYTMTNTKSYENYKSNSVNGPYYFYSTGKSLYLHELNRSGKSNETCYFNPSITADCNAGEWKTLSTKISLMYASDYALSLGSSALSYTSNSNYSTMKTGWMHISNNDSGTPSSLEWTMSRSGHSANYRAWAVNDSGGLRSTAAFGEASHTNAVRPVFYLTSDVEILGGTGAINDPYILK